MEPDCLVQMGLLCAKALLLFGTANLYVDEQGGINMANPTAVFLNADAVKVPHREPVYTRPVMMSGRPQYVALRDGALWEVEYPEVPNEPQDSSGEGD